MSNHDSKLVFLKALTEAFGPSGHEQAVAQLFENACGHLGSISRDALGGVAIEKKGQKSSVRVVLDAHLDEVGFMVAAIEPTGRLRFEPLGGWWPSTLLAQRVQIKTSQSMVNGVIGSDPPHLLTQETRHQSISIASLTIDIGADSAEDAFAMGVEPGCFVVPLTHFGQMKAPDLYWGKALDNRLGLGVMIEVMKNLESINHDCDVVAVGSVQEEVGIRGAPCSAALTRPDLSIILEAPPADDTLSVSRRQSCLGKGPQLRLLDGNTIFPHSFCDWVRAEAKAIGVDCQVSVKTSGGTNAKAYRLHAMGLPCVVIGVPARYIHSHVGLFHWQDYLDTIKLVTALVAKLNAEYANRFRTPWGIR